MSKHQNNFNVAFPQSVNADHQAVEVIHKEVDPMGNFTDLPDGFWKGNGRDQKDL